MITETLIVFYNSAGASGHRKWECYLRLQDFTALDQEEINASF